MGTKAKEIVGLNVDELITELNKAYADEWLAYYQYWITAKVATGRQAGMVAKELEEIAEDELEHAAELAERILTLGGQPLVSPKRWFEETNCGYAEPPKDPSDLQAIIKMVVEAERCAIGVYDRLAKKTLHDDPITYQLMLHILEEEIEHEDAFERLL
jgi:bacterioferritin